PAAGDPSAELRGPRRPGYRPGRSAGNRGPAVPGGGVGDREDDPRGSGGNRLAEGSSVERRLAVMAGAGVLPGRAAAEAARQGWHVVALAFDEAADLGAHAERVVPSTITDVQAVLRTLADERVQAAIFVGKFWKQRVFDAYGGADDAGLRLASSGLSDGALAGTVLATLAGMGIEVLDQRPFLSPWMMGVGTLTSREPAPGEWEEIRAGFALARRLAEHGIGQT